MATGKTYRQNYRFLSTDINSPIISSDSVYEFDESDIWNNNNNSNRSSSPDYRKTSTSTRYFKKSSRNIEIGDQRGNGSISSLSTASSLPVNVPDWSKILRDDYRDHRFRDSDGYGDGEDCFYGDRENRVPPHELVAQQMARNRVASFSVHEGIGRTLKGRDLSRVRNAIWEKTGFED